MGSCQRDREGGELSDKRFLIIPTIRGGAQRVSETMPLTSTASAPENMNTVATGVRGARHCEVNLSPPGMSPCANPKMARSRD